MTRSLTMPVAAPRSAARPLFQSSTTGGLAGLLWYFAAVAGGQGILMLIAPSQFLSPIYAAFYPHLGLWALLLAGLGAAALLTVSNFIPGRWAPVVFIGGALPCAIFGAELARNAVFSGLISYGGLAVTLVIGGSLVIRGRLHGDALRTMFGVIQLAIGIALLVIPQQFDNAAVYGAMSINARPVLLPLFFIAGTTLLLTDRLRSDALARVASLAATITCGTFAVSFLSANTWTGVVYYGFQVPFLLLFLFRRTTWRTVIGTLVVLAGTLSVADFANGLFGVPGAHQMTAPVALSAAVLALGVAGHVGWQRGWAATVWVPVASAALGLAALAELAREATQLAGPPLIAGGPSVVATPVAVIACSAALWAMSRGTGRWSAHVAAAIAAAVLAVAIVNLLAVVIGVPSLPLSLGWTRMRLDGALVLAVCTAGLIAGTYPKIASGPVSGRIFAGMGALLVVAAVHQGLSNAGLAAAVTLAVTDPIAADELIKAQRSVFSALFLIKVALAIGTGVMVARTISSPLGTLSATIRAIGSGRADSRVPPLDDEQLGELGASFNRMADQVEQSQAALEALNAELEERVAHRTAQLEAARRELEAFSYSVSHDLRAPLRSIDGFSLALLEDHGGALPSEGKRFIAEVRGAASDMGRLIDDLLRLSLITRASMRLEVCDLSGLTREILAKLASAEPTRVVQVSVVNDLHATVDVGLVRRALENLLGNAWKFSANRPDARIEFGRQTTGEHAFFVRDNGAGFDMAYAGQLFGPFQRLHAQDEFSGSGIGLATAKRVIVRHGGRVWAESEPGRGATFFFTLADGAEEVADATA